MGVKPPDVGIARGTSGIELYRSVSGVYSWRVAVVAKSGTERAIREAMALAEQLDGEMDQKYGRRRNSST